MACGIREKLESVITSVTSDDSLVGPISHLDEYMKKPPFNLLFWDRKTEKRQRKQNQITGRRKRFRSMMIQFIIGKTEELDQSWLPDDVRVSPKVVNEIMRELRKQYPNEIEILRKRSEQRRKKSS